MADAMSLTLAIVAFGGALVLLARYGSFATAMVNAGLVALLALALVLQSTLDGPAVAYVAFALAAISFVVRWLANGALLLGARRARARPSAAGRGGRRRARRPARR